MTTKERQLTVKGNFDLSAISSMTDMSKILKQHIVSQGLSTVIAGKNYVNVEGWQFAGGLMGMVAKITRVENLSAGTEKKWRADVEIIRLRNNIAVGFGMAICSSLEIKKKNFDEYAICSQAQTRAIGKAYRNMIGWVMKLAGYEATPSEEMKKVGEQDGEFKDVPPPKNESRVNYLIQVKDRLHKMGATTETQALKLLKDKTGLTWKSFKDVTPKMAQMALGALLK